MLLFFQEKMSEFGQQTLSTPSLGMVFEVMRGGGLFDDVDLYYNYIDFDLK